MADCTSSWFFDDENNTTDILSDGECAEQLQLQEVVEASLGINHLSMSSAKVLLCDICFERKGTDEMFKLENCSNHSFCSDCISQYVQSKIQEKKIPVTCPGLRCPAIIEPAPCRSIIPENVFARWEDGLTESTIPMGEKINYPYIDCNVSLIYNRDDHEEIIIECTCPHCQRPFCAQCRVPWHDGHDCDKFKKDDLKVEELAKKFKWMTCPHCKSTVDKVDGCIHMTCVCKLEFCYICGGTWNEVHWSCQE
ncbi:E3 ubiquitin-protein ligase RSL1-like [Lycium barbarum]|uniref:E3 ubiquitin-protein ligase RSL1-like n=1 Tax=Lycium barbarum TaxID=112863 RepID=UPI00293E116E|nr:E3 ubiquitin-protein ligase RSL1-like [Lycium barbarum]